MSTVPTRCSTCPATLGLGNLEDQRHPEGGVVGEQRVAVLVVLAASFAVVAGDHDQGSLVDTEPFELPQHRPQALVRVGDLSLVGVVPIETVEGRRRT